MQAVVDLSNRYLVAADAEGNIVAALPNEQLVLAPADALVFATWLAVTASKLIPEPDFDALGKQIESEILKL